MSKVFVNDELWTTIEKVVNWYFRQEKYNLPTTYQTLDKKHAANWLENRTDNAITEEEKYGLLLLIKKYKENINECLDEMNNLEKYLNEYNNSQ